MTEETVLTNDEIMSEWEGTDNALSFARAIEQAVLQSPQVQALREDAERYRWLKENIMEQYNLPGSYYLPDDAPEVWDRTIDAAKEQT